MPRRAGGCLAAKSAMAHASANSIFERKTLSVHGCWAFRGTIHLQHTKLELDLLSIHHLLPGGGSPYLACISIIQIANTAANGMVTGNEGMIVS